MVVEEFAVFGDGTGLEEGQTGQVPERVSRPCTSPAMVRWCDCSPRSARRAQKHGRSAEAWSRWIAAAVLAAVALMGSSSRST